MMEETGQKMSQTADEAAASSEPASELLEPRWAVVSFERCEAIDLTYADAVKKMDELESQSVAGLCIVTNETAERM
jgi:hypothetical protein